MYCRSEIEFIATRTKEDLSWRQIVAIFIRFISWNFCRLYLLAFLRDTIEWKSQQQLSLISLNISQSDLLFWSFCRNCLYIFYNIRTHEFSFITFDWLFLTVSHFSRLVDHSKRSSRVQPEFFFDISLYLSPGSKADNPVIRS